MWPGTAIHGQRRGLVARGRTWARTMYQRPGARSVSWRGGDGRHRGDCGLGRSACGRRGFSNGAAGVNVVRSSIVATDVGAVRVMADGNPDVCVVRREKQAIEASIEKIAPHSQPRSVWRPSAGIPSPTLRPEKVARQWLQSLLSPEEFWKALPSKRIRNKRIPEVMKRGITLTAYFEACGGLAHRSSLNFFRKFRSQVLKRLGMIRGDRLQNYHLQRRPSPL